MRRWAEVIRLNPAAIGIGAPIQCGRAFSRGPKRKIPPADWRDDGKINPESVERLRANGRSCYVSAAHAASFVRSVSARTFAEALVANSRDIALAPLTRFETAQQKTLEAGPTRVRTNTRRGHASRSTRDAMRRCNTIHRRSCSCSGSNTGYRKVQGARRAPLRSSVRRVHIARARVRE